MKDAVRDPEAVLPLTPAEFHILLALSDGERHGYSIMQEIAARTDNKMRIGPATLYRSIKRMLDNGLIGEVSERPDPALDDQRRRYYELTDFGRQVAQAEARRLEHLVDAARDKQFLSRREPKMIFQRPFRPEESQANDEERQDP